MKRLHEQSHDFRLHIELYGALALINPESIDDAFELLREDGRRFSPAPRRRGQSGLIDLTTADFTTFDDEMERFRAYLHRTWVGPTALFNRNIWSHYETVRRDGAKTTGELEAWHMLMNATVSRKKFFRFWYVLEHYKNELTNARSRAVHANTLLPCHRRNAEKLQLAVNSYQLRDGISCLKRIVAASKAKPAQKRRRAEDQDEDMVDEEGRFNDDVPRWV